jgi:hypothetical protein
MGLTSSPGIAQRPLEDLTRDLVEVSGSVRSVVVDPPMVSSFAQDRPMLVALQCGPSLPVVLRVRDPAGAILVGGVEPAARRPAGGGRRHAALSH